MVASANSTEDRLTGLLSVIFFGACGTATGYMLKVKHANPVTPTQGQTQMAYCSKCGGQVSTEASFCGACGTAVLTSAQLQPVQHLTNVDNPVEYQKDTIQAEPTNDMIDKSTMIRQVLKGYDELTALTCLECGYEGMMGIIKSNAQWYFSWWVLIPVLMTGIGTIPAAILIFCRYSTKKHTVECPSCRNILITKNIH